MSPTPKFPKPKKPQNLRKLNKSESDTTMAKVKPSTYSFTPARPTPSTRNLESDANSAAKLRALVREAAEAGPTGVKLEDHTWAQTAFKAEALGYIRQSAQRVYIKKGGLAWLGIDAAGEETTGLKTDQRHKHRLNEICHKSGTLQREALDGMIDTIWTNLDALQRVAAREGLVTPWEAIPALLRGVVGRGR